MTDINGYGWPPEPKWMGPGWDTHLESDATLTEAYNLPDYELDESGDTEVNWLDLYSDASGTNPVGRLWLMPDQEACGVMPLGPCDTVLLAVSILRLRQMKSAGVDAFTAYESIRESFFAGEEQTGDLQDALDGTPWWPGKPGAPEPPESP